MRKSINYFSVLVVSISVLISDNRPMCMFVYVLLFYFLYSRLYFCHMDLVSELNLIMMIKRLHNTKSPKSDQWAHREGLCRRLVKKGDPVSFWAHVNLPYRVVSYPPLQQRTMRYTFLYSVQAIHQFSAHFAASWTIFTIFCSCKTTSGSSFDQIFRLFVPNLLLSSVQFYLTKNGQPL